MAAPDALRILFEALNPLEVHLVERKLNLATEGWATVDDAFFNPPPPNGNTIEVIIPTHGAPMGFYRVLQAP